VPASRARKSLAAALVVVAAGALAFAYSRPEADEQQALPGMVRQTEVRIAPEVSGRLASIAVAPGQHVKRGELLAVIDDPDLTAALAEATAASASAGAERAQVYSGTRVEQVSIGAQAVRTAEANLLLARQQNDRAVALNTKSFLSQQQLDESKASLAKAKADLEGKRAQHAVEQAGPTREERGLADAKAALAKAGVASLEAELEKTRLLAPADGTIGIRVAEPGEIMAPGKPVMTLDLDAKRWFCFTLREDRLQGLTIGSTASLTTNDGQRFEARVSELRPLGEFATWRAARAVGDHDLNSFRMRLDPMGDAGKLEPGMTVWLQPGQGKR
jgi:HlyD family secretion protein